MAGGSRDLFSTHDGYFRMEGALGAMKSAGGQQLYKQDCSAWSLAKRRSLACLVTLPFSPFVLVLVLSLLGMSSICHAFVQGRSPAGYVRTWGGSAPVFFANYINKNSLSYGDIFQSLTKALSRWKNLGTADLQFDYWQGANSVDPVVTYDHRNTVLFYSQNPSLGLGGGVIGVTYVYSQGTQLLEADIVFNDVYFQFTTNPKDTSNSPFWSRKVFLENVATHEFGHAYGLSHSNSLQSSMMWQESAGQSKPACDDAYGMASLYPSQSFSRGKGSLSGSVLNDALTSGVSGAVVHAISLTRGSSVQSVLTDTSGQFQLDRLEPGSYALMIEPYYNAVSALCGGSASGCPFGNFNSGSACQGNTSFKRFFPEESPGRPRIFSVGNGVNVTAGQIVVSCQSLDQKLSSVTTPTDRSPVLISGAAESTGAAVGKFGSQDTYHYFRLPRVLGSVKVKVLAFSLYSPAETDVDILDAQGQVLTTRIPADKRTRSFPESGDLTAPFVNFDSSAQVSTTSAENLFVRIKYQSNLVNSGQLYRYPGGSSSQTPVDSVPFYLVLATLNDGTVLSSELPDNVRCENSDSFSSFVDHGEPPVNTYSGGSSGSGGSKSGTSIPGCGVIQGISRGGSGGSGGESGRGAAASARELASMILIYGLLFGFGSRRLAFRYRHR